MFHAERPQPAAVHSPLAHASTTISHRESSIAPARAPSDQRSNPKRLSPSDAKPALRLDGISKAFGGHEVLRDVSLKVVAGSIHGIIGKSGAGKTTLIRIAGLLESPDSGSVLYEGVGAPPLGPRDVPGAQNPLERQDVRGLHSLRGRELLEARRQAGFVFQSFNLFASRSAAENVAFPLEAAGWPRAEIQARVAELLAVVGLADKAERPAARLSGGEKQRVALARALANRPSILFSDEATSALDPETTRAVLDLIRSLRDRYGLTVVMVTHQMEVVRRICDSVSFIAGGSIVEQGDVAEVFAHPRSDEAKAFLREDRHE